MRDEDDTGGEAGERHRAAPRVEPEVADELNDPPRRQPFSV